MLIHSSETTDATVIANVQTGKAYTLEERDGRLVCRCPSYAHRGRCKHLSFWRKLSATPMHTKRSAMQIANPLVQAIRAKPLVNCAEIDGFDEFGGGLVQAVRVVVHLADESPLVATYRCETVVHGLKIQITFTWSSLKEIPSDDEK